MRTVKVQYTVKPDYVEQNKSNIAKVMEALKANPIQGMQYAAFTDSENPNTFVHINMAADEGTLKKINEIAEFKSFQQALKSSQPLVPPRATKLNLVASGFDLK